MSTYDKRQELEELRARVRQLESEMTSPAVPKQWVATEYYTAYYATTGFLLGGIAAMSSLLFNIVGALIFEKNPLELIRVYLTFPMGEQALNYDAVNNGLILAIGCCLYLGTGMLYGIFFEELSVVMPSSVLPDQATLAALFEKYDMELLGPPLNVRYKAKGM